MRTCSINGCTSKFYAKGMCNLHYTRVRVTGTSAPRETARSLCDVTDCDSQMVARGYCNKHWKRWRTHGDPLIRNQGGGTHVSVAQRFHDHVAPAGPDDCWTWLGTIGVYGYGVIGERIAGVFTQHKANRLAYEIHRGPIPDGMLICHTCDNRACVNPAHLYAGTVQDNNFDRWHGAPAPRPNPELVTR